MHRAPLALPAIAVLGGVLLARQETIVALTCALLVLALLSAFVLRPVPFVRNVPVTLAAVALAAGVADGALRGHPATIDHERRIVAWGTVIGDVVPDAYHRFRTVVALDGGPALRVVLEDPVVSGERLELHGTIAPIDGPRNPGEPSLRQIAADDGIAGELMRARVLARAPPQPGDMRAWMPRARAWASAALRSHLEEPYASILAGALWGERGQLPADLRAEFQATGTVHVLVTAGLHLGVVAGLALLVFSRVGFARTPAALLTLAVVWLYVWFSGGHVPSLRAATMASVVLVARACGARSVSWNTYAAAVSAVALAWPASVGSASFALSFSCVGAIVLFAGPIAGILERARLPHIVAEPVALTVATQLGVWPLTAAVFLLIAPYAPLANVAVVPTVGIAMTLGISIIGAHPLPPVADSLARLDAWILAWIVAVVKSVAHLPGARVDVAPPLMWQILAYDAALVAGAALFRHGNRVIGAAALASAFVLVAIPHGPPRGALHITALDVGQADAILITTPGGHAMMIDTGGKLERGFTSEGESPAESVGERVVVPYLLRAGIAHLDGIILTHPHGDHVGGCAPILRHLPVGWIADSGQIYPGHAYHDCLEEAARRNVPVREPRCGSRWTTDDGVTLSFLAPCEPYFTDGRNDVNENSIVVLLSYRGFRALFMGDAGAQAESRMLASGANVQADVLKVGHHGSAYSSTLPFIEAVAPKIAIVSVGRHNLFGHPAPSTLRTLESAGAQVYRTDLCGAVSITGDTRISVAPYLRCGG